MSFLHADNHWVCYQSYQSIEYPKWLELDFIEFYLRLMIPLIIQNHKLTKIVKLLSLRDTQHFFLQPKMLNQNQRGQFNDKTTDLLILPWLTPNRHYVLIIIDNAKKKFYYFDSDAPQDSDRVAKRRMEQFCRQSGRDALEVCTPSVQQQDDGHSCGVFTVNNVLSFLIWTRDETLPLEFENINPNLYRIKLHKDVMDLSDDVRAYCPKCVHLVTETNAAMCLVCNKKMHNKCIKTSPGTLNMSDSQVICFECCKYLLKNNTQ